jgi:hypothetical protein
MVMMRLLIMYGLFLSVLTGCDAFVDVRVVPRNMVDIWQGSPDLAYDDLSSPAPCLAAQGISGTLLMDRSGKTFCVDFDKGGLTDAALVDAGWTLAAGAIGCSGFTITNGRLTIKAPTPGGAPECKAGMPKLVALSHPQKVFVSIVHYAELTENTQSAAVSVNATDTQNSGWTGKNVVAPQKSILEFYSDGTLFSGFLSAKNTNPTVTAQLPKWNIQSIAVFGAP